MNMIDQITYIEPVENKSISVEEIKKVFGDLFYNRIGDNRKVILYTNIVGYNYFKYQLKIVNFIKRIKRQYE